MMLSFLKLINLVNKVDNSVIYCAVNFEAFFKNLWETKESNQITKLIIRHVFRQNTGTALKPGKTRAIPPSFDWVCIQMRNID
jgi:hypothetical protein